ncbi:MAG: PA14 domain-containing protein [Leptolyngbyaceae cyanobacterium bins.349]|nr:PA14 domain-containing protein [Leptolyngbyaceae cyanobacterium bins.349]
MKAFLPDQTGMIKSEQYFQELPSYLVPDSFLIPDSVQHLSLSASSSTSLPANQLDWAVDVVEFGEFKPTFNNPNLNSIIEEALSVSQGLLVAFANSEKFFPTVTLAFGNSWQSHSLNTLQHQWATGDFGAMPAIQIRSSAELNGALGAFAQATNTIYLSQSYLEQNAFNPQAIAGVLLEEVGHFVDATINLTDAPGDEGAIFSTLVQAIALDAMTLQALKLEDDSATITLDGKAIQIEQSTGNGLQGEYFDNADLTNRRLTRIDSTVNFNWGTGSPNTAIAPDTFSTRWTGQVQAVTTGTYTFFVQANDGVRLWVNNVQLINDWEDGPSAVERRGTIALTAGQRYNIRLEYFEETGNASAVLLWSGPSITKQVIPQGQLFSTTVSDTTAPTATATPANITTAGGTTYQFAVTYADNVAINAATIDGNDVRVTGPNGFNQLATRVSVNTTGNGTPRTATYRITAPGGTWDSADAGTYTLALQANQISDTSSNFVAAGTLGTFSVNLLDAIAPTATATPANITTAGGTNYQFSVTYSDNTAVNIATLNSSDILVTGPGGFNQLATLVSVNNSANGTPRTATYQITAPGNTWDSADNGTYTLALQPNQVSDTSGNFAVATTLGSFLVNLTPPPPNLGENIVFPADAGVLNVRDFGARGDGVTDDTAAIQAALNAFPNGMRIIYLPNGTYLVSDTLSWPAGTPGTGNDYKNTIMQGQSRDGVVIRLRDGVEGFGEAAEPKAVIFTGPAPAQRFGNSIRNLTVDTGTGNPGAIGIQFNASNQGSMRQVTIRSGDGQGVAGLDFDFADEIGPLLVKDVTVQGFQYGIQSGYTVNSQTFENITLQNQSVYGFWNASQVINIRNLTSTNAVPAIFNGETSSLNPNTLGHMTLINATLNGIGGAASQAAIVNGATLLARGITTSGYGSAIASGSTTLTGPSVTEFVSKPITSLFTPAAQQTLNLPVRETPDVPWDALTDWANVVSFGAIPNDGIDDSAAFQAAIDSGKTTVYLPVGNYDLSSTVLIRNNVRRIIGTEAFVGVSGTANPGFRIIEGNQPTVVFERIRSWGGGTPTVENASSRTLVVRDTADVSLKLTGSGDLFLENVVTGFFETSTLIVNGQNVWARQLNIENLGTKIINNGGNLWILGLKTERGGTIIDTRNGGKTELLGGLAYTTTTGPDGTQNAPLFINNESSVSLSFAEVNYGAPTYTTYIRETRGGVTRNLSGGALPNYWGSGEDIPLYVGY